MADHFAKEIMILVVAIAFIGLFLLNFSAGLIEKEVELNELRKTDDFDSAWLEAGDSYAQLEDVLPADFYLVIIIPLIIIGTYIAIKTVSGVLPNWISGG